MPPWLTAMIAVVTGILGSSGIWALVLDRQNKRHANSQLLLGLAHAQLLELCEKYIGRGWITADEYENLHDYLYLPYKQAGGNGTITRMMNEIDRLPVRPLPIEGVKFSDVQK